MLKILEHRTYRSFSKKDTIRFAGVFFLLKNGHFSFACQLGLNSKKGSFEGTKRAKGFLISF